MSHALAEWETDKTLYVFTSLTAGSSHIVTATSRIETILRANRLHFTYIDTATNESARKLYGRRGRGKKLPLLVKQGEILGDLNEIEEFNEFGELKQVVGELPPPTDKSVVTTPAKMAGPYSGPNSASSTPKPSAGAAATSSTSATKAVPSIIQGTGTAKSPTMGKENAQVQLPMHNLAAEAAAKAQDRKKRELEAMKASLQAEKAAEAPPATAEKAVESTDNSSEQPAPTAAASTSQTANPAPSQENLPVPTHRGSELSLASDEEIKEIEKESAIPEEGEQEDQDEKKLEKELNIPLTAPGQQSKAVDEAKSEAVDMTEETPSTTEAENDVPKEIEPDKVPEEAPSAAEAETVEPKEIPATKSADKEAVGSSEVKEPEVAKPAIPESGEATQDQTPSQPDVIDDKEPPVDEAHAEESAGGSDEAAKEALAEVTEAKDGESEVKHLDSDALKTTEPQLEAGNAPSSDDPADVARGEKAVEPTKDQATEGASKADAVEPTEDQAAEGANKADAAKPTQDQEADTASGADAKLTQDQPAAQSEDATKSVDD